MSLEQPNRKKQTFHQVRGIMGISMGVIYIIIACGVVYFEQTNQIDIGKTFSYIIGGLMAGYGIFRIYRGFKMMKGEGY